MIYVGFINLLKYFKFSLTSDTRKLTEFYNNNTLSELVYKNLHAHCRSNFLVEYCFLANQRRPIAGVCAPFTEDSKTQGIVNSIMYNAVNKYSSASSHYF